ncbi:MAG TPA: isochorismatase family protein [Actinomycetes bacterium]|nr:isochorismatase family protein [Actinomycetes bacterium]
MSENPTDQAVARYDDATALLVVDVQNDFADPKGGLYVRGGEEVVSLASVEVAAAQNAGATIVYTQDWHPESTPHFEKDGGIWPVHCVADTWGAELHPNLLVHGAIVRKGTSGEDGYSGFSVRDPVSGVASATQLQSLLDPSVRRLVVIGLAGDYCVKETALDGVRLGYEVEVPAALTRFVEMSPGDAEQSLQQLRDAGVTVA